jgi:hypothetical protein
MSLLQSGQVYKSPDEGSIKPLAGLTRIGESEAIIENVSTNHLRILAQA